MGCGGSRDAPPQQAPPQAQPISEPVTGQMVAPPAGAPVQGKGQGKGKGKGKGKGGTHWQIKLGNNWKDYEAQEDMILKRAYMTGQKNAKFQLRGQKYEYNFKKMLQKNKGTGKERMIRPPASGPRPPSQPVLPHGPMIIITVGSGQPGTTIEVNDPNNPGQKVPVFVPGHAKPGQKMAVPIPEKGETMASVQEKQEQHDKKHGTKTGWSTGGKVAAGGAALVGVAAVGVGGVILGDHLAGGEMAATIGEAAVDAGDWAVDVAPDVADAAGDAAADAGDWAAGAAGDAGDWAAGAADDVGAWAAGDLADFAGDAGDWLGDAGEDIGDFVMDLF